MLLGLTAQHMFSEEKFTEAATQLGFKKYEIDKFFTNNPGDIWSATFDMLEAWRQRHREDTSILQERLLELLEPAVRHDVTTKLQLLISGLNIKNVHSLYTDLGYPSISYHSLLEAPGCQPGSTMAFNLPTNMQG